MTQVIDGKKISKALREKIQNEVAELKAAGKRVPGLAVIQVGDDQASSVYVKNQEKACEKAGFVFFNCQLPADTTEEALLQKVKELNEDPKVDGIICQMPLPEGIDADVVINNIRPDKDVDGFHPVNAGKLLQGKADAVLPCTPAGVIEMLKYEKIPLQGKNVVVLGRSNIVGKPAALLLLKENCTVTICHSKTQNLAEVASKADILVSALGRAKMVDASYTNSDQVVIDVGINRDENGKLCGDVDYEDVAPKVKAITPVPGGVGSMTIAILLNNTLKDYKRHEGIPVED